MSPVAVLAVTLLVGGTLLALPASSAGRVRHLLPRPVTPQPAPRRLLLPAAAMVVLAVLVTDLVTAVLVLVTAGVALGARTLVAMARQRRAAEQGTLRVIEACTTIAGDLAAGRPARDALRQAALEWPALEPVAAAEELGADVASALRAVARTPGAGGLRVVAAAWEVSSRSGAGLADTLHELASTLRADRATALVIASELSSARATARLMAVLPLLVLGLGTGIGGDPWGFLLQSLPGVVCLAVGLGFAFLGVAWIERLARATP